MSSRRLVHAAMLAATALSPALLPAAARAAPAPVPCTWIADRRYAGAPV